MTKSTSLSSLCICAQAYGINVRAGSIWLVYVHKQQRGREWMMNLMKMTNWWAKSNWDPLFPSCLPLRRYFHVIAKFNYFFHFRRHAEYKYLVDKYFIKQSMRKAISLKINRIKNFTLLMLLKAHTKFSFSCFLSLESRVILKIVKLYENYVDD